MVNSPSGKVRTGRVLLNVPFRRHQQNKQTNELRFYNVPYMDMIYTPV